MRLILPLLLSLATVGILSADHHKGDRQYLEVRTYHLAEADDITAVDNYIEHALLPALKRQGIGPVGVFGKDSADPDQSPKLYMVIPFDSLEQFAAMQETLDGDKKYQLAASGYFAATREDPRFVRIASELLHAFEVWPQVTVPAQTAAGKARLFELRSYESHTEKNGAVKVEMFNNGEVPVFDEAGIKPVFMGRAVIGSNTPNLTYMTVFDDMAAVESIWNKFRELDSWKKLSSVEKYKGTVTKIHKTWLRPRAYSGL